MTDDSKWARIERDFDAPITAVWDMWTKPENFQSWYGPNGASIPTCEMDLTIGGARKICMAMQTPKGEMRMWFTGVYKEITAPNRLVYTEAMCDADGTLIPPSAMGMPEGTPDVTEIIVDLTETNGKTRMVMIHRGVPTGTAGEGGWKQAIEKMAGLLAG